MKKKVVLLLSGGIVLLLPVLFVAYEVRGAMSNTPTTPIPNAACTPTPTVRHPTFTVGPNEGTVPNIVSTKIAAYQATYPGDHIVPAHTTDLAPQIARNDKSIVIIRHADCTYEEFLVAESQIPTFAGTYLKSGDSLYAQVPPPGAQVARPKPPTNLPGQTPGVAVNASGTPITHQPTVNVPPTPSNGARQTVDALIRIPTRQPTPPATASPSR